MDLSLFALTDKVAIVTGSGRGIGRAIALGFARAGANVVVTSRTSAQIEDTATKIRKEGRKALVVPADVQNPEQVTNLLNKTLDAFGRVDILVNNAGGTRPLLFLKMSLEEWEAQVRENLTTTVICTKIIGGAMVKQKSGNIINISSIAGLAEFPFTIAYAAAKAGIVSFTKTLAVEWAPYNIRVNAIAPGFVMTGPIASHASETSDFRQAQLKAIPLRRFGQPEDMAGPAIFLASDASAYVTGATLVANGGITTTSFEYPQG